jgi:hypothetical protein
MLVLFPLALRYPPPALSLSSSSSCSDYLAQCSFFFPSIHSQAFTQLLSFHNSRCNEEWETKREEKGNEGDGGEEDMLS